jgi:hypothetical protein
METVYAVRGGLFGLYRDEMERYFRSMDFRNPVLPYTAVSGFIFTNLDEGEKVVHIDLVAFEYVWMKMRFERHLRNCPVVRAFRREIGSVTP